MEIITRQTRANNICLEWSKIYDVSFNNNKTEKYLKLKALGNNPNPDDIDRIIGNTSWTVLPSCTECKEDNNNYLIKIEMSYDENDVFLC